MCDGERGARRDPRRLGIAVPTFNEADNLAALLQGIDDAIGGRPDLETTVLVIDDASPDGTGKVAEDLARRQEAPGLRIEVLHRPSKAGLGRAYTAGIIRLLDNGVDLVAQMDADLSHDPSYLPALLDAATSADVVVGSRYVPGGGTPDWSPLRRTLSRLGNRYARLWLGSAITDHTGGFNVYSADLLRSVGVDRLRSEGYGYLIELKYAAMAASPRVAEVPIVFRDRRVGESKIPPSTIVRNLVLVPRLRLSRPRRD